MPRSHGQRSAVADALRSPVPHPHGAGYTNFNTVDASNPERVVGPVALGERTMHDLMDGPRPSRTRRGAPFARGNREQIAIAVHDGRVTTVGPDSRLSDVFDKSCLTSWVRSEIEVRASPRRVAPDERATDDETERTPDDRVVRRPAVGPATAVCEGPGAVERQREARPALTPGHPNTGGTWPGRPSLAGLRAEVSLRGLPAAGLG